MKKQEIYPFIKAYFFFIILALLVIVGAIFAFLGNFFWAATSILSFVLLGFARFYVFWLNKMRVLDFSEDILKKGRHFSSLTDVIKHTVLEYAESEIICFHDDLSPVFFANSKIIKKLKGPPGSLLKTEIIFGPKINLNSTELLKLVKEGKIILYQLPVEMTCDTDSGKFHHFISVDDKHVWLEYCHERDECGPGMEWHNEVYVAAVCREFFEEMKKRCNRIDFNSRIIETIGRSNFVTGVQDGEWILATEEEVNELAVLLGEAS